MEKNCLKYAIFFLFLVASGYGYAQNTIPATNKNNNLSANQDKQLVIKAALGTYQIVRLSKVEEVFTTDYMNELLIKIENNRQVSEEKILTISEYTQIRILSKNSINDPGFIPVQEYNH